MADEEFALPKSGWGVLTQILRGYFHAGGRKSRDTVAQSILAQYTGLGRTQISQNNAFLQSIGVLERENRSLRLTDEGLQLALALDHHDSPSIQAALQRLYADHEFIRSILSAVKVRDGMDEESLEKHVLLSAGAPSKAKYRTGARTLLESLELAGLLTEEDGKWRVEATSEHFAEPQLERLTKRHTVRPRSSRQPAHIPLPRAFSIQLSLRPEDVLDEERLHDLVAAMRRFQHLLQRPDPEDMDRGMDHE